MNFINDKKYDYMRRGQIKEFKELLFNVLNEKGETLSMFCENNRIDYLELSDFLNRKTDKISGKMLKAIERGSNYKVRFSQLVNVLGMRLQIWYVDLGEAIGREQRGIRPCVILSTEAGNVCSDIVNVAMITGAEHNKAKMPTHVELDIDCGLNKKSIAMLEQTRTIDKSRLVSYVGTVTRKEDKLAINKAYKIAGGVYDEFDEISEMIESNESKDNIVTEIHNFKSIAKSFLNFCKEQTFVRA